MPRFSIGNSSSEDDEEVLSFVQRRPKKHRLVIRARRVPPIVQHINYSGNNNNNDDDNNTSIAEEEDDDNLDGVDSRLIEDEEVENQRENDEGDGLIGEEDEEQDEELFVEEEESSWIGDEWYRGLTSKKRKDRDREGPSEDNAPISVTLTDPDVLDCPICLESLAAPVFQCENGHTACSSCCSKLRNKCPSCSLPIGYNRCRAIEKVLESIKISCRNMKYGCKETVSYSKKHEHEQTCIHEPCSCPQPGCDFVGSSKRLYQHFNCMHPDIAKHFCYDSFFSVYINTNTKYVILQEEVDRTLFILNYGVQSIGNVANITCIAPSSLQKVFSYELIASKGDSSVKLKSFTESMPRWSEHPPWKAFLLVPNDFLNSSSLHLFQICIRRSKEVPSSTPKA